MKDIFNRLQRKGFSNAGLAHFIGVRAETIRKIKAQRPDILENTKNKLILKRAHQALKYANTEWK